MKKLFVKTQLLLIAFMACIAFSCKKQKTAPVPAPETTTSWVESSSRKDTIVFLSSELRMFELNRGKEMRNGYLLPKTWGGLYTYKFKKDSIEVHYTLSSLYVGKFYSYKIQNDKLYIGDFFQKEPTPGQVLTFEKLK